MALLWGASELPKGNVRHRRNHHNLELRRGETSLVKYKPKPLFLFCLCCEEAIHLMDTKNPRLPGLFYLHMVLISFCTRPLRTLRTLRRPKNELRKPVLLTFILLRLKQTL